MIEALRSAIFKLLGFLVPRLVGWIYKPDRIAKDIKIRPVGEGEAVTVLAGELPNIQIWLQVTNLSPFTIELDRLLVQVQIGAAIGEFSSIRRISVKPASEALVKVESALTQSQISMVCKLHQSASYTALYVQAYINCQVHNLELSRNAQTTNVRVIGVPIAA